MKRFSGPENYGYRPAWRPFGRVPTAGLVLLCLGFLGGGLWLTLNDRAAAQAATAAKADTTADVSPAKADSPAKTADSTKKTESAKAAAIAQEENFQWFEPIYNTEKYGEFERYSLYAVLGVAILGLLYAGMLVGQVTGADKGTPRMQEIAGAVREGANAYLAAQFRKIVPLIIVITALLYATKYQEPAFAWGRSRRVPCRIDLYALVGLCGMTLATTGNLRVAAAARHSYGEAMQLGYRTGTVTGMLTDGLGLLGGTCIFLIYGERAYEALLGFGFGGTLLALFMRVGGGIYTKAADVGADLVGKVEAGIPEDDPRNAATIADNVGDNVGDCAGMAADIFESYEVTIVAAMILGMASFGHKGVIFPLLVRGIGVLGSIISTYTVKAGANDTSDTALNSVHRGFWIGSAISVIGFVVLGFAYLRLDDTYIRQYPQALSGYKTSEDFDKAKKFYNALEPKKRLAGSRAGQRLPRLAQGRQRGQADRDTARRARPRSSRCGPTTRPSRVMRARCSAAALAKVMGVDAAILTCLIGIVLAIVLNKLTSFYTHTTHEPVKTLARACQTGHATNIIQGFAVGYESAVHALPDPGAAIACRSSAIRALRPSSSPTAWPWRASAC